MSQGERSSDANLIKEAEPKPLVLGQHVYTRVGFGHSPRGLEGWQSLRYTQAGESALNENNRRTIEARLDVNQNFQSSSSSPRWEFFPLGDNRVVFTRVVPRNETNRSGRTFLYLAHSLVLADGDLDKLPNGALALWDNALYYKSLEEVEVANSDTSGKKYGLAPRKIDPISMRRRPAIENITPQELVDIAKSSHINKLHQDLTARGATTLADFAKAISNAKQMKQDNLSLAIQGTDQEIQQVLQLALLLAKDLQGASQTDLSFTTWTAEGANLLPGRFWAYGVSAKPRGTYLTHVDAAKLIESLVVFGGGKINAARTPNPEPEPPTVEPQTKVIHTEGHLDWGLADAIQIVEETKEDSTVIFEGGLGLAPEWEDLIKKSPTEEAVAAPIEIVGEVVKGQEPYLDHFRLDEVKLNYRALKSLDMDFGITPDDINYVFRQVSYGSWEALHAIAALSRNNPGEFKSYLQRLRISRSSDDSSNSGMSRK